MRYLLFFILLVCLALPLRAEDAPGYEVMKVNHEFIDKKGNTHGEIANFVTKADYQWDLQRSFADVAGIRFIIHWKAPSLKIPNFTVKVEARGLDAGTQREVVETIVKNYPHIPSFSGWTFLDIKGQSLNRLGKLMAWKVTLLQDGKPMATRKSFMWDDSIKPSQQSTPTK